MPVEPPEVDSWPEKQGKNKKWKEDLIDNILPDFGIHQVITTTTVLELYIRINIKTLPQTCSQQIIYGIVSPTEQPVV